MESRRQNPKGQVQNESLNEKPSLRCEKGTLVPSKDCREFGLDKPALENYNVLIVWRLIESFLLWLPAVIGESRCGNQEDLPVTTKSRLRNWIVSLIVFSFCALPVQGKITIGAWEPLFKGIEHAQGSADEAEVRLQKVNALRVDLTDPDISFIATGSNGDLSGETTRQTGSQFVTSYGVQAAVNAHFYSSAGSGQADLLGLCVSEGQVVSSPNGNMALLITQQNSVRFETAAAGMNLTGVWTAIETWPYILGNGVSYGSDDDVHPRSAVGISQNNRYLILITIDGRQTGYSAGATLNETAQWLMRFGAYNGLNLDGGGSTHMWVSDGAGGAAVLNSPSENRSVGSHLGIYAAPLPPAPYFVYADFEGGLEGPFYQTLGYSGSTTGIDEAASTAEPVSTEHAAGAWSQKLTVVDDPAISGGWKVRHLSATASRSGNTIRPTTGWVGFWAKTSAAGVDVTLAIDNTSNVTADLGVRQAMPADGKWHLYQWHLENDDHWEGWYNGDGIIDTPDFTLDSLQFFGPDTDAIIYIDTVSHNSGDSLGCFEEMAGDLNEDCRTDIEDLVLFAQNWLACNDPGNARCFTP